MNLCYRMVSEQEFDDLIQLWNNNIEKFFPLDKKIFYENIVKDKSLLRKDIIGAFLDDKLVGFIIFKKNIEKERSVEMLRRHGSINIILVDFRYRKKGIGTKLKYTAENILLSRGVKDINIGECNTNLIPGIPVEFIHCKDFFLNRGYKIKETFVDLISDIKNFKLQGHSNDYKNIDKKYKVQIENYKNKEELLKFCLDNFKEKYVLKIKKVLDSNYLLTIKDLDNRKIVGMSIIYDGYLCTQPSINWTKLLDKNFGGILFLGIDKNYRKQKLGSILLGESLKFLKENGTNIVCIPSVKFDIKTNFNIYYKFNFIPWKGYNSMEKNFM